MAEPETLPPKAGEGTPAATTAPAPEMGEGGRRRRVRVDLTTGSIPKKLFAQAWPQVTEGLLNISEQITDVFWAGRLPL